MKPLDLLRNMLADIDAGDEGLARTWRDDIVAAIAEGTGNDLAARLRSSLADTAHALRQVLPEHPDANDLEAFGSDFDALEEAEALLKETEPTR